MSIFTPFTEGELIPQEERIEVVKKGGKIKLGIPKESLLNERRISLTPDAVSVLTANGIHVVIESGAGQGAHYTDTQYSEAGAKITYETKEAFSQPIVLKTAPPTLPEIDLLSPNAYLISSVQINTQKKDYFEKLNKKKITALGYEYIRDHHDHLAIIRLLGEIAGTCCILIASELLSSIHNGNGLLMGGITGVRPTNVVIIGAGTVGENAARSALGLGATVKVFDNSLYKLRRLQELLGRKLFTSTIDPKELSKSLMRCDVAIGCLRGEIRSPVVVTELMVEKMKPGSIIIDASIDNGGVFETSNLEVLEKTYIKHNVIHYCVPNITSRVARTATKALSNFFLSYILEIASYGGFESLLVRNRGFAKGVYMYKGRVTNQQISSWYNLPYHDINLLII